MGGPAWKLSKAGQIAWCIDRTYRVLPTAAAAKIDYPPRRAFTPASIRVRTTGRGGCARPEAVCSEMSQVLVPVILSGGTGTRLWPLSRKRHPKQFVALLGGCSPLQATAQRLRALEEAGPPIVVCGEAHRSTVAGQLRSAGVPPEAVILEPAPRNTAPAIAAAAFEAIARSGAGRDPVLLVLPADHAIPDRARFADAVRRAVGAAASGNLVAFGVVPTRVETGYGYITAGPPAGPAGGALAVERFVEKPDADTALACMEAGNCYWNSGMFVFGARQFLRDLHDHAPEIHRAVQAAHEAAAAEPGFLLLDAAAFARAPARSVDHAVMERAANAAIVPFEAGWSDIGSWASLSALSERDAAGNSIEGDAVVQDAQDCFIRSEGRMVAAVGVRDLVIVDTPDAVLVLNRHAAEDVKALVAQLERAGRDEHESPPRGPATLGELRPGSRRGRLQGEACHRSTRRAAVPAVAPLPGGTLDRDTRRRTRDARRRGFFGGGERDRLRSPGCEAPSGEPGNGAARADRGADRPLSRGGRYRPLRG